MDKYIFPELSGDKQTEEPAAVCDVCGCELYAGEVVFREYAGTENICEDCLEEWARKNLHAVRL